MNKYQGKSDESFKAFQERLKNNKDLPFYNLNNTLFKKVLESRDELIKKCLKYETNPKSSKTYEKV